MIYVYRKYQAIDFPHITARFFLMFFTSEDPHARISSEQDPLGAQEIWNKFARLVVTNLTSITTSVRGYTTLLLGLYLIEKFCEEGKLSEVDGEKTDAFIRFEQIAAYVRYASSHKSKTPTQIIGSNRVSKRYQENPSVVKIGTKAEERILANQKAYGVLGVYSSSARKSGLICPDKLRLTQCARKFVHDCYIEPNAISADVFDELNDLMTDDGEFELNEENRVYKFLESVLAEKINDTERKFFGEFIRDAEHVDDISEDSKGIQECFSKLLLQQKLSAETELNRERVLSLKEEAVKENSELSNRLDKIIRLEAVLAVAIEIFEFMQTKHDHAKDQVVEELRQQWKDSVEIIESTDDIELEIKNLVSDEVLNCFKQCRDDLAIGNYKSVVHTIQQWHEIVMKRRDASAWVEFKDGDKLNVRLSRSGNKFEERTNRENLWRNHYYIPSLISISDQLKK